MRRRIRHTILRTTAAGEDAFQLRIARLTFQCRQNLACSQLGRTCHTAGRKCCLQDIKRRRAMAQASANRRDEIVYRGVSFDLHQLRTVDRTESTDATEIVAEEVDDHEIFGEVLRRIL